LAAARLQAGNCERKKPAARLDRQGRHRQRQAHLPALSGALQRTKMASPGRPGRANAATPLGQHGNQEPRLPRRDLHRGVDRPRYRQHDPARDAARFARISATTWPLAWACYAAPS
jgi:hypothetical protein